MKLKVKCKQQFEVQVFDIGLMSNTPITIIPSTIWETVDNTNGNGKVKLVLHGTLVLFQIETEIEKFEQYFEKYEYVS